jgi:hypothetical protein
MRNQPDGPKKQEESEPWRDVIATMVKRVKEAMEPCDHAETDHGICLYCGKQCDDNAHDWVDDETWREHQVGEALKPAEVLLLKSILETQMP